MSCICTSLQVAHSCTILSSDVGCRWHVFKAVMRMGASFGRSVQSCLCFANIQFPCRVVTRMHPVMECRHKCLQAAKDEPEIHGRRGRLAREYLLGTSERCRGLTCVERVLSEISSLACIERTTSLCKPGRKTADWHINQPAYIEFRRGHSHSHDPPPPPPPPHHHHHHHHCTYIHHHPSNSFPHTLLS